MLHDALPKRMFLILHNPYTGEPLVGEDLLRCGIVCAELAELVLARRLVMENDLVVLAPRQDADDDEIGAFVIESIRSQSAARTMRTWVGIFAEPLHELVAHSLETGGVVRREKRGGRLLRRRADRFPAADLISAFTPRLELENLLRSPSALDVRGNALAALLGALGLERALDFDDRETVHASIAAATATLPIDLRHLVTGARAVVAAI